MCGRGQSPVSPLLRVELNQTTVILTYEDVLWMLSSGPSSTILMGHGHFRLVSATG